MGENSKIEWCDSTVNFWSGCTKVSTGCAHCYAETPRLKHVGAVKQALAMNRRPWICDQTGTSFSEQEKAQLLSHDATVTFHRRRIFSNSLSDWLDDEVRTDWLLEMLFTIWQCDQVIWILCTKQPENFWLRLEDVQAGVESIGMAGALGEPVEYEEAELDEFGIWLKAWLDRSSPPHNIILLASVENQALADQRIPELLKIPAKCRGLNLEPLLGPVDLARITDADRFPGAASFDVLSGKMIHHDDEDRWTPSAQLDWLIIGGESGPQARPCNVDWIRSLVEQGKAAGVPVFFKQMGTFMADEMRRCGHDFVKSKKGEIPAEWPADLRVQNWPEVVL